MKSACEKWKDPLREAALTGAAAKDLEEHLRSCAKCSGELDEVPGDELAAAQKLAEWRAPSDGLLATPGQEILQKMPRLGESYLRVPVKTDEEE
jgi:hypothetical protein